MPFFPIMASADDRSTRGAVPVQMQNVYLDIAPEGAVKRTPYLILPTPGLLHQVTPSPGNNIRGLFSRPGVQDSALFAAAGDSLFSIAPSWASSNVFTGLTGTSGRVLFDSVSANLLVLSNNNMFVRSGGVVTQVTDPDFPAGAYTLASLADRAITSAQGSDTFDWSAVGNALDWPALAFAASARQPDEIRSQIVLGGDLWHFGAATAQIWRAVGGDDEDAFDLLSSLVIDRGIVGRDAIAKLDSLAAWIGEDRTAYQLNGYAPARIPNRDLERRLADLSEQDAARIICLGYSLGSHLNWLVRMPSGAAHVYDLLTQKWHTRKTFEADAFQIAHYARFGGNNVVASDTSDKIWTWSDETYDDDGNPIERIVTLHIPFSSKTAPISNITLDMKTIGQPVSGQGSDPEAMISFSRTGGSITSIPDFGIERTVKLGQLGQYGRRPTLWRLGAVNAADGLLLRIRITDPVGFALSGVWINELPV